MACVGDNGFDYPTNGGRMVTIHGNAEAICSQVDTEREYRAISSHSFFGLLPFYRINLFCPCYWRIRGCWSNAPSVRELLSVILIILK